MKIIRASVIHQVQCPQKPGHVQVQFDLHGCLSLPLEDAKDLSPEKLLNVLVKKGYLPSEMVVYVPKQARPPAKIKTQKQGRRVPVS